uniref:platelet glycoprotein V n=1 Tax=Scatophagus argus TaxID=75038 RepID=UPI001ED822AA|nr:platelet glycoprotein V [Scatophagus argus]
MMDSNNRGTLWMMLILFLLPHPTCSMSCPSSCLCNFKGAVKCVGATITDIPKQLPGHTYMLQLDGTNMTVINEQSLANKDLLLRFSLTRSHLHSIHPRAFHIAPQLKSVKLSSNDLSSLPPGVFSSLTTLEQLHLDGNQLETIAPDMLEGLVGLRDLDLSKNKLQNLSSTVFDGLSKLHFLNLGRNFIKRLPPTIFQSLTELQELVIYNNDLQVLEAGIFDGLVNLEELKLHHNQITSIPPQVFLPLRNLMILTLSSNQLEAIPEKSFYNMPMLKKLTLYNNPLLSLPDQLMGYMPDMREFYLYSTNLTTVPGNLFANMSGLLTLNFHLNDWLHELPSDLFCCLPNLNKLSLKSNNLVYLHPQLFYRLTTLGMLVLNDNKLQSLPENIFQNLRKVRSIDLKNNNLKTLPGDIFLSNSNLSSLTLSGNPWDCTCSIRHIAKWIKHNEHVVLDRDDVMCHSPMYQMLRTVGSLSDEEFSSCDAANLFPMQTGLHKPTKPSHSILTSGQTPFASTSAPPTTTSAITQADTQQVIIPTMKPSVLHTTIPSTSLQTQRASLHNKELILNTQTSSLPADMSVPFYDKLVVEQGPEFVHHSFHKGWIYVWVLPSNTALVGFLMFCHILLVTTGLFLILAAMYQMYRLTKITNELEAECAHIPG